MPTYPIWVCLHPLILESVALEWVFQEVLTSVRTFYFIKNQWLHRTASNWVIFCVIGIRMQEKKNIEKKNISLIFFNYYINISGASYEGKFALPGIFWSYFHPK